MKVPSFIPDKNSAPGCSSPNCCGGITRRDAIKWFGMAAASALATKLPVMAGPFENSEFEKLVPSDKKLSADWVKSLFDRGTKTVYRGTDLKYIGMPIGGLCAGQLYLGGDGKLWHWDIFNQHTSTGADHYAHPMEPASNLDQGFALMISQQGNTQVRAMDHGGWSDISFNGEYPIGRVEYRDTASPIHVFLEAFSPFIPLDVDDSSLPATVMRFTVKNSSPHSAQLELAGWLENPVCFRSGDSHVMFRRNRITRGRNALMLDCSAEATPTESAPAREDIVFDDFEREDYGDWKATGTAFGRGPVAQSDVPNYQGNLQMHGKRSVNTHSAPLANDVLSRDAQKGTLTSKSFIIERQFITFLVGGGAHKGKTCVNLLIDNKAVLSATGAEDNRMKQHTWNVRSWQGKTARIEVVDNEPGPWGNIGLDYIVFTDRPRTESLTQEPDFGTIALTLLEPGRRDTASPALPEGNVPHGIFSQPAANSNSTATRPAGQKLVGSVTRRFALRPGESGVVTFLMTWHFPNLKMERLPPGRHYGTRFSTATAVAEYVAQHFDKLRELTHRWHDTWYDSTLPYWLLDRTFLNTSILATSTSYRFANGRFWGWEGVGCCHGTCGHVWQYAHAMARLFPSLERDTRERVDFGLALQKDGAIFFRGEFNDIPAIDAQSGTILRALREHQMSANDVWLKRNWPAIKRATEWLISKDVDSDGIIESNQHNTLDTDWFGPVAWLSGMYLSALRASEEMAREVEDEFFAKQCRDLFERGQSKLVKELFNGEYFINKPDPKHLDSINSGSGCEIDQVFGQSWAFQVGLGRVLPERETRSALKALWKYNFAPDVGAYRAVHKPGRWYAMPGEAGLLMCTFPRSDWTYDKAKGKGPDWAAGYFNECMNGFEYQVAGHLIAEGMLLEGLTVARAVHDRYQGSRRNPWNEVECGDHYARSMASYGIFLTVCGYEYHGPKGHIGFAPKLSPENFRTAFTAAEGWGYYSQKIQSGRFEAKLELKYGNLRLRSLALEVPKGTPTATLTVQVNGKRVRANHSHEGKRKHIKLAEETRIGVNHGIHITIA